MLNNNTNNNQEMLQEAKQSLPPINHHERLMEQYLSGNEANPTSQQLIINSESFQESEEGADFTLSRGLMLVEKPDTRCPKKIVQSHLR